MKMLSGMVMLPAIDVSKWQGRISPDVWRAAYAFGFRVAIIGSWHGRDGNPYAWANLRDAREVGFITGTYIVVNARPGRESAELGQRFCGTEWQRLSFAAVDVEVDGVTIQIIKDAIIAIEAAGQRVPIYTGGWFWRGHLGNPTDPFFKPRGLWHSYYDRDPDVDFANRPFGPWALEDVIGEQYQGTTPMFGTQVDLSVFREDWITAGTKALPEEEGEELTVTQYEELKQLIGQEHEWVQTRVHDAIIRRLADLEKRVNDLSREPTSAPPTRPPKYYTVKRGDTAGQIARAHGLTLFKNRDGSWGGTFADLNGHSRDWNKIYPDEQVRVK